MPSDYRCAARADAGDLQDVRRVDGAAATITSRLARTSVMLPPRWKFDAGAALALEHQVAALGVGLDAQVGGRFASRRKVCAVEPRKRPRRVICE